MIRRYSRPQMAQLFEDQARYDSWLRVELAVMEAWAEAGVIPATAVATISQRVHIDPARVEEIEATVRHDVIAFTQAVSEQVGAESRYFHYGLTSSDVTDTALMLTLQAATEQLIAGVDRLRQALAKSARAEATTPIAGRTHGMIAEPTTLGHKFALYYEALSRDRRRLIACQHELAVGKLSGAIGTYLEVTPEVERSALGRLGLRPAQVSSQVLDRDRHAQYLSTLAILAGNLERLALEVRLLQRSEVREVQEPFAVGQKGSSAMPHKRNPVVSERICGLARLVRAYAQAGMEDIALWHERDISHSSTERVALADASILSDFMLAEAAWLIEGLVLDRARMAENLSASGGLVSSQRVLLALVRHGMSREAAYQVVQEAAFAALAGGDFRTLLAADPRLPPTLRTAEWDQLFDLAPSLLRIPEIIDRALNEEVS
ncbi:MAG: adenylosuccinate lyase [Sulfobacillus sp.]